MGNYGGIKTQFVRDRMKETAWADHVYIDHLIAAEKLIAQGGAKRWTEGMALGYYSQTYPIEVRAIRQELEKGKVTTPEEFRKWVKAVKKKERRAREASQRARQQQAERDRDRWLELGGRE